jgi:hypothetical protein
VFGGGGVGDDCAVVERCDGIVLVGGRISSGMRREMEHGVKFWLSDPSDDSDFEVYDLTWWCGNDGQTPLTVGAIGLPFAGWYRRNDMGRALV